MSSDDDEGERARHLREVLPRVPVFPLPDVVLFPHALLPLHIFEPRYRKMTRDVLVSHQTMVLARLLEAERPGAPPPRFSPVAGVGELVLARELPDGRFNIVLRGMARVRLERELVTGEPYRLISAVEVPDEPITRPRELEEAAAALRALVGGMAEALPDADEVLRQMAGARQGPGALADVVAAALVGDAEVRQELLETTDVLARLERVTAEVVTLAGRLRPSGSLN